MVFFLEGGQSTKCYYSCFFVVIVVSLFSGVFSVNPNGSASGHSSAGVPENSAPIEPLPAVAPSQARGSPLLANVSPQADTSSQRILTPSPALSHRPITYSQANGITQGQASSQANEIPQGQASSQANEIPQGQTSSQNNEPVQGQTEKGKIENGNEGSKTVKNTKSDKRKAYLRKMSDLMSHLNLEAEAAADSDETADENANKTTRDEDARNEEEECVVCCNPFKTILDKKTKETKKRDARRIQLPGQHALHSGGICGECWVSHWCNKETKPEKRFKCPICDVLITENICWTSNFPEDQQKTERTTLWPGPPIADSEIVKTDFPTLEHRWILEEGCEGGDQFQLTSEERETHFQDGGTQLSYSVGGVKYTGPIQGHAPHGQGNAVYIHETTYKGGWMEGMWHGKGRLEFANGDYQRGNFREGEFVSGKMRDVSDDGSCYEGDTQNNKYHGKGRLDFPGGDYLDGSFQEGMFVAGKTRQHWDDGEFYEGDVQNRKFHGRGRWSTPEAAYDGEWEYGKKHGQGMLRHKLSGDYQDGTWVEDAFFSGKGKKTSPDSEYEGDWKDGKWHGQGIFRVKAPERNAGDFYDGTWVENKFASGQVRVTYSFYENFWESSYQGETKNGKRHGRGHVILRIGTCLHGFWKNGKEVKLWNLKRHYREPEKDTGHFARYFGYLVAFGSLGSFGYLVASWV